MPRPKNESIELGLPFYKVLVLCPHPDDEYACAGTIRRLVDGGSVVAMVVLSDCIETVPAGISVIDEMKESAKILGVERLIEQLVAKVRVFDDYRQAILQTFISLRDIHQPDLVLCPASFDTHQDHRVVYEEAYRAFKHTTIWGYSVPWNNRTEDLSTFVILNHDHNMKKIVALDCYESQMHRPYMDGTAVLSQLAVTGLQCGNKWAEGFETIRTIY